MTIVNLTYLRELYDDQYNQQAYLRPTMTEWRETIDEQAPALFDELEALRAEVERLRAVDDGIGKRAVAKERSAIVAWLRREWESNRPADPSDYADALERGDHHESAGK